MKEKIKWDYTIEDNDNIKYFDPKASYELTGYRPIDEENGLDFDPKPFQEIAFFKQKNGVHTFSPPGSVGYKDFWLGEIEKCKSGVEINGYRITGNHYFFLNFYKLLNVGTSSKASSGRTLTNPDFWSKHYEYFHYLEMCQLLDKDACALKSRGVGFSEIGASIGTCEYTCIPNSKTMYIASAENYLLKNGVLQKVWDALEILNQETEGGLRHARMKKNEPLWKRASLLDKQGQEFGFMSEVFGQVVDNPRKLRGTRLELLLIEEAGSFQNLITTYNQSQALVDLLGTKVGTRVMWGTGGDVGANLIGLETIFLNPTSFNILPYKHNYNEQQETVYQGFFIPAFSCMPKFMDNRGVTNTKKAKDYYETQRKIKAPTPQNWLEYCSEFCFYPEEALSRQGQNSFDQAKIAEQMSEIKVMKKSAKGYKRGKLSWNYREGTSERLGVRFTEDNNGPIIVVEEPITDDLNMPLDKLYVAGIDSIDHAENDSVVGADGSKFAITVKKRTFGNEGDVYVCMYIERPKDIRTAYDNAEKILHWYGCKANLEDTKIGFRMYLQERKTLYKCLMKRPIAAQSNNKRTSNLWGTPGSEKMIQHGLALVTQYVEDFCHNIWIMQMLEQLNKFSYEAKGRFDIIMAMVYTEIGDEDMMGLVARKENSLTSEWLEGGDVGYFKNDKGYIEFGCVKKDEYGRIYNY